MLLYPRLPSRITIAHRLSTDFIEEIGVMRAKRPDNAINAAHFDGVAPDPYRRCRAGINGSISLGNHAENNLDLNDSVIQCRRMFLACCEL